MAFTKTVTSVLSNATAAAGGSTSLSTEVDTTDFINLAVEVKLTFNASATLGARIKAFACNASGGTYDTYPFWQADIARASGVQGQSFQLPSGPKYVEFLVTNLDGTYSITAITIYVHDQTVS